MSARDGYLHPPAPSREREEEQANILPPRLREGSGVGSFAGIRRPTNRAQQLRREATPAERRLWTVIGASRVGHKFSRQIPVGTYICDFPCRKARLAIELDGDSHAQTVEYDARRTQFIEARGIRMLRFSNADVFGNLAGVVAEIERALAEMPTPDPSRKREGGK